MENLETLSKFMDKEKATEILKLTKAYDNYVLKFKKKLDKLLEPVGHEVKAGIMFTKTTKD